MQVETPRHLPKGVMRVWGFERIKLSAPLRQQKQHLPTVGTRRSHVPADIDIRSISSYAQACRRKPCSTIKFEHGQLNSHMLSRSCTPTAQLDDPVRHLLTYYQPLLILLCGINHGSQSCCHGGDEILMHVCYL
jgi:hypothetical protein